MDNDFNSLKFDVSYYKDRLLTNFPIKAPGTLFEERD